MKYEYEPKELLSLRKLGWIFQKDSKRLAAKKLLSNYKWVR